MPLDTGADVLNEAGMDNDSFSDYNLVAVFVPDGAGDEALPGAD